MNFIDNFYHPVVRDLAWVIASPSLLDSVNDPEIGIVSDDQCREIVQANLEWLLGLDSDPQALIDALSHQKSARLGYYFEDLVAYWLLQKISDGFFESHLKVSVDKQDLGEFDFLYRDADNYYHWETAVKFYLYSPSQSGEINWYGPNTNDTLHEKLSRMIRHQVRLSERAEAKAVLAERGVDCAKLQPKILMKGYLFYPLGEDVLNRTFEVADCIISPAHLYGWWLSAYDLDDLFMQSFTQESIRWRQLPKAEWLAPRVYGSEEGQETLLTDVQLRTSLQREFERSENARLIAGYVQGEQGDWRERTRGFIVRSGWPARD